MLAAGVGSLATVGLLPGLNRTLQPPGGGFWLAGLTGDQQVPPLDTSAQGGAMFGLGVDPSEAETSTPTGTPTGTPTETPTGTPTETPAATGTELHYALAATDIEDAMMAHIHLGPVGENGEVVVWLYPSPETQAPRTIAGRFDGVLAADVITEDDLVGPLEGESIDALVEELQAGDAYVNVHTEANPAGEIRGQVLALDALVESVDEWQGGAGSPTPTESPMGTPEETPTGSPEGTPTESPTPTDSGG